MIRSYLINDEYYYYALTTDSGLVKVQTNRIFVFPTKIQVLPLVYRRIITIFVQSFNIYIKNYLKLSLSL